MLQTEKKTILRIKILILYIMIGLSHTNFAQQNEYFPPKGSDIWETIDFQQLNWCEDKRTELIEELEENDTKAFLILKSGRIVMEEYFDGFHRDSSWIWFSAGKSLSSFLLGLAQEEGVLDIQAPSQDYLGEAWSSLSPEQESEILVRHHMSMTTGLDYIVNDPFCTDAECLSYLNEAGSHWFYHNAPYSLLRKVLENSTGQNINVYTFLKMHLGIGMDGLWVPVGFNNFYISTARSMARFGLLMLNRGSWDGQEILSDMDYFESMITSSQQLNPSYGLLWWLNGKSSFKLPGSDVVFPGPIVPDVFPDMYCAIGAESQIICVVPSEELVIVRMGLESNNDLVPTNILRSITGIVQSMICPSSVQDPILELEDLKVSPNPVYRSCSYIITNKKTPLKYEIYNSTGMLMDVSSFDIQDEICLPRDPGLYYLRFTNMNGASTLRKIIKY